MTKNKSIDIESLRQNYKKTKQLEKTKDVRSIIYELAQDDDLLLAYYCLNQPDFIYPGVAFMSFERFKQIITNAFNDLPKVNESVVKYRLKDAFIKSGVDKQVTSVFQKSGCFFKKIQKLEMMYGIKSKDRIQRIIC